MKKLKHNITITVPEELREEIESAGQPFIENHTIEIYYTGNRNDGDIEWEVYLIRFIELMDEFDFSLNAEIMDIVRALEEHDEKESVEMFIYNQLIECIGREEDKREARDFFEEISD